MHSSVLRKAARATIIVLFTLIASTDAVSANASLPGEPCAIVAQQVAATQGPMVEAGAALACLRSVPLDGEGAVEQLLRVQTMGRVPEHAHTAERPSIRVCRRTCPAAFTTLISHRYQYPAVDIPGGLENIYERLRGSSYYINECDFQLDIFKLVQSSRDGHFNHGQSSPVELGATRGHLAKISLRSRRESSTASFKCRRTNHALSTLRRRASRCRRSTSTPMFRPLQAGSAETPSSKSQIDGIEVESCLNELAARRALSVKIEMPVTIACYPNVPNAANGL